MALGVTSAPLLVGRAGTCCVSARIGAFGLLLSVAQPELRQCPLPPGWERSPVGVIQQELCPLWLGWVGATEGPMVTSGHPFLFPLATWTRDLRTLGDVQCARTLLKASDFTYP